MDGHTLKASCANIRRMYICRHRSLDGITPAHRARAEFERNLLCRENGLKRACRNTRALTAFRVADHRELVQNRRDIAID
jgi:hypothetical protein